MKLTLPTDSAKRKRIPLRKGVFNYFPAALAGVAEVSIDGNDKHNPGQPLHHARGKSADHADCIDRHLTDVEDILANISRGDQPPTELAVAALLREVNQLSWRALALAQELHEKYGNAPMAPAAVEWHVGQAPVITTQDVLEGLKKIEFRRDSVAKPPSLVYLTERDISSVLAPQI